MPFIIFNNEKDHKTALDIIASVIQSLENSPLERLALFSPIITLESKFPENYHNLYFFCKNYLELFNEQAVEYTLLEDEDHILFMLSREGQEQLEYIKKYRPQHLA